MKEAFDLIRKRIEENFNLYKNDDNFCSIGRRTAYKDALFIVSEVEAEYGKKVCSLCYLGSPCEYQNEDARIPNELMGWIPCSERLPEEPSVYLVCYKNPNCFPSVQLFSGGRFLNYYLEEDKHVIAWMPLPEAYKPEKG